MRLKAADLTHHAVHLGRVGLRVAELAFARVAAVVADDHGKPRNLRLHRAGEEERQEAESAAQGSDHGRATTFLSVMISI